ncbi:hypothetical protein [Endozoicomonas sp. ALC020]|uniref:hypothetical protein n=1 Tax=unclassified Endozoicomonas TaxID=2644528 RepID=UPI003BAE377E
MKKTYYSLGAYGLLFFCLAIQVATIPQAVAENSLSEPMSLSSLFPLLATVYRNMPEAKSPLPDLNPPPQPSHHPGNISCSFDTTVSVVAPQYHQIKLQIALAEGHIWQSSGNNEPLDLEPRHLPSAVRYIDPTGHCHEHWVIQGVTIQDIPPDIDPEDPENSLPPSLRNNSDLPTPFNFTHLFAGNGLDRSDSNDLDAVQNPLTHLLPAPYPLSIRYAESGLSVLFQDSIWLRLNQEESLVLAPSEFPAVAKVSDMSDENWPQLIAAESVHRNTDGVRSVLRWTNRLIQNALSDDPLLRFLAFIHGTAFLVQDSNGQLSYIIQRNGKLLSISRFEAHLRLSLYSQSFLESLYPEIFGPSLPAGGGWHECNRWVRKKPFHPYERSERDASNGSGAQRPVNPEGGNNEGNDRSTRSEAHAMHYSEQTREPGTASTERDGRQAQINRQKVDAIYDYQPPENRDETPIPLYATAFLNGNQQHLYCPVCTEFITGEAKACTSSVPHSVCIDCFDEMTKAKVRNIKECITCSEKMHNHSFNYEDAAAVVMFQCPLGCGHSCPLAFIKNHIKEQHTPGSSEDRSVTMNQEEEEQAMPPGSVLFYGVPVMAEDKDRVEQFLHICRQINDPEHLQLAGAFTRVFEALQNRPEQSASVHSGRNNTDVTSHHPSYAFFNSREKNLDSAYLQCVRSTDEQSAKCRFCNVRIGLNQNVMDIREHLSKCSKIGFCPNRDDGCSFQHQSALMPTHLLKCRYNKVKCQICHQQVALTKMSRHRKNCLASIRLNQDDALFYDRTEQKPVRLWGQDKEEAIPVFKKPGEATYYCKISKLFYESITKKGNKPGKHSIKFIGDNPDDSDGFSVEFRFDTFEGSLSLLIFPEAEHRRMALPVIFNGKGEKLEDIPFVMRGDSSCDLCGYEVNVNTMTHPDPYPICLTDLLFNTLYSQDKGRHINGFPECVYVQIKLTPVGQ